MTVNIFNCKGHREMVRGAAPPDFYIGRPSPLGNPYPISYENTREEVIEGYRLWIIRKLKDKNSIQYKEFQKMRKSLKDFGIVNLWCWCYPQPCHGNIIKEILLKTR